MTVQVYLSRDAASVAVGADDVAIALTGEAARRGVALELIRTGSRGLCWLEPLVEVATPAGRVAYGPVAVADVGSLLDRHCRQWGPSPAPGPDRRDSLAQAPEPSDLRPLRRDRSAVAGGLPRAWRLCRAGRRALSIGADADRRARGAVRAARPRRRRFPDRHQVEDRGAGRRPTQKYIVCNADEGDSRHLRRPHADGRRSVRADRGHDDRRHRRRRHAGLHLHALGISRTPIARADAGHRAARAPAIWVATSLGSGQAFDLEVASAPAPISAARKPRCWKAWKASAAGARQAAAAGASRACSASRPSSTT